MKNLILKSVLFLSLTVALVSCNKDDAPAPAVEVAPSLIGKWEFSRITNDAGLLIDYVHKPNCSKDNIEITETTIYSNKYNSANTPCVLETQILPYTKAGNVLTTQFGSMKVTTLTSSELRTDDDSSGEIIYFKRI